MMGGIMFRSIELMALVSSAVQKGSFVIGEVEMRLQGVNEG